MLAQGKDRVKRSPGQFQYRSRICLLKGCGCCFLPSACNARYCSEKCRKEVRRWSVKRAQERYRQTAEGKKKRKEQSQRYRERAAARDDRTPRSTANPEGEGNHVQGILCFRPGCYCRVLFDRRWPLKKFCSLSCRQALRRVLLRESRWRKRMAELI